MTKTTNSKQSTRAALKIVGHRGARGLAPENTIAAVRKGIQHGVDELEIDVRVTKDRIAIVHHDSDLQDETSARMPIKHFNYAELKQHKPDLATLEEIIDVVNRQVPIQIEVKGGEPTKPVIDVLQTYLTKGWHENDFLIGSKSQRTLLELHQALPAIPTVVIEPFSGVRATLRARQLGTKRISMRSWWLWSGFISPMTKRGYQLYAYSLNDPLKARRWAGYGLTGIITDFPDYFEPTTSQKRAKR